MLIEINNRHESSGLTKHCDFKISSNGIMIKALTSRLYSNPIASIVRELASNALDANPTIPMQISMPGALSPNFSIRDYGPGLSPDMMAEVFCHFGESTKRNSNSQIGGYGLGAKSPFAYVNSFTIISHHAGTCTTYIASIGTDGIPGLHIVSSQPTTESGLQITIPAADFSKWREALSQIEYFSPTPIVDGVPYQKAEVIYEDSKCILFNKSSPKILVGPVAYPLDTSKSAHLEDIPIALKFDIGEIEVTASREEIVYNSNTMDKILIAWRKAKDTYQQQFKLILDNTRDPATILELLHGKPLYADYQRNGIVFNYRGAFIDTSAMELSIGQRHRKVWRPTRTACFHWTPNCQVVHIDVNDTYAMRRIQEYFTANPFWYSGKAHHGFKYLFVVDDTAELDNANIPYLKLSSMPPVHVRRTSPKQYRTWQDGKFVVSAATSTHYIQLDADKKIPGWTSGYTAELHTEICNHLKLSSLYVLPHNFKGSLAGLVDVAPILQADCEEWTRLHETELKYVCGDYHTYDVLNQASLIKAFSDLGMLPPYPKSEIQVPPVFRGYFKAPQGYNWKGELDKIFHKYPVLRVLRGTHTSECRRYLTDAINLIVKGY